MGEEKPEGSQRDVGETNGHISPRAPQSFGNVDNDEPEC